MNIEEQHKQVKEYIKQRVFLIDVDGKVYGKPEYTRWENAKWYQRILGNIFKRYKSKFIDVVGFESTIKND